MKVPLDKKFMATSILMDVPQDRRGFLVQEVMEIPRTPQQLQEWVDWVLEEMTRPQYKEYCLLRVGLSQQFYDEIYPLNYLIQNLFANREDVICRPKIGSQPYDAILKISGQRERYVEVTFYHDGSQDNLDMKYLISNGNVTFGETKRNNQGELENEMTSRLASERRDHTLNFIKEALISKSGRGYGSDYILIIAFDDHISFGNEENRRILSDFAERELDCSTSEFEAVYLVGMSGENIIPLKALSF